MIQLSCCTDYASEHNVSLLDFRKFAHKQPVLEPQSKVQTIIFRNRQNQIFNLVRTWFVLGSYLVLTWFVFNPSCILRGSFFGSVIGV